MADRDQTLFIDKVDVIVIAEVLGSSVVSVVIMYHLITMILCNKSYDITAYQNALAQAASMEEINSVSHLIPAHKYEKKKNDYDDDVTDCDDEDDTCAVCLGEFEEGEELRTLPKCMQSFHVACIDTWLCPHSTCPICRANVTPSPEFGSGELNVQHSISIDMV